MDEPVREFLVGQGHDPETATEAQVQAAEQYVAAFPPTPATTPDDPATPEAPDAEGTTDEPAGDPATPERQPVAASRQIPDGAVVIDAEELARLRAGAETATRLATEQATRERDGVLMAARDEGRFPPARLEHYRLMWDKDPDGTRTLLTADEDKGGLAKGAVPLTAKSDAPDPTGSDADGLTAADRTLLEASRIRMGHKTAEVK